MSNSVFNIVSFLPIHATNEHSIEYILEIANGLENENMYIPWVEDDGIVASAHLDLMQPISKLHDWGKVRTLGFQRPVQNLKLGHWDCGTFVLNKSAHAFTTSVLMCACTLCVSTN